MHSSVEDRLSDHDIRLARHEEQIGGLKRNVDEIADQLKWQMRLLVTTLVATVGTLVTTLVTLLLKH